MALRDGFNESYWLSEHEEAIPFYTGALSENEIHAWIKCFQSYHSLNHKLHKTTKDKLMLKFLK